MTQPQRPSLHFEFFQSLLRQLTVLAVEIFTDSEHPLLQSLVRHDEDDRCRERDERRRVGDVVDHGVHEVGHVA